MRDWAWALGAASPVISAAATHHDSVDTAQDLDGGAVLPEGQVVIAGAIEWMVQGWSERASGEQSYNDDARNVMDMRDDQGPMTILGRRASGVPPYCFMPR